MGGTSGNGGLAMDYITVREAALKWGVSQRQAQLYCINGRVPGAKKFSGAWAIPADAQKPEDPRRAGIPPEPAEPGLPLMPLMNTAFPPGRCLEAIRGMADDRLREIALAEYCYFSGQPEKAILTSEPFLSHPEPALRMSACLIYSYASLSVGQIQRARRVLAELRQLSAAAAGAPAAIQAAGAFVTAAAAVLLHLPVSREAEAALQAQIHLLPPGLRMFALYIQAHHAYLLEDYGRCIGIAETAFSMQDRVCPIPSIYMHLAAVMGYMGMKQPEQAQAHLRTAWALARPDDLIEGLGEHHGLLGGMLEVVLKKDYPEDFRRIIAITYRFSAGWRRIHNPATGHDVADNLTTTEFATAMLAARGWTNQEIADHLGVSHNTVKRHISLALQKLNLGRRQDLKNYMLR